MKKLMLLALTLISVSSFASQTKYNCSVTNYVSIYDTSNFVENLVVTLDEKPAKAILPVSKKRVEVSLTTFQTTEENINQYGQYQLHVMISEDKDELTQEEIYVMTGTTFVGLDNAIQVLTTASYAGRSMVADVGVQCNKL
ncbi:MAG: hypothetical protein QE271_07040 [Bacteriovoracaceae bacterium]|nr:hypothetical protein [Bacteriovoracaceae bacterium]